MGTKANKITAKSFILSKYIYVFIFVLGAIAFLYPLITSMINAQTQTQVISNYESEMASMAEAEKQEVREEAESYNDFVASLEGNVTDEITDEEKATTDVIYMSVMTTGEAIGYVEIPKIEVELPIFHGSSDAVLERGIGHLERSSLPVGGKNTHSVLSGHRGLPTARLFRDLGMLELGDIFFIDTLGEKLAYEIESKKIVLPYEVESLRIQEGRDLATLVTCEPYMINSHRMLLTGHRIDYTEAEVEKASENSISFFEKYIEYFVIVLIFALIAFISWLLQRYVRKKQRLAAAQNRGGGIDE